MFLRDDRQDIQDTVLDLKRRVGPDGFVFSSGGIGPTHDDITYEALASVLGELATCLNLPLATCVMFLNLYPVWHMEVTIVALPAMRLSGSSACNLVMQVCRFSCTSQRCSS